MGGVTVIPCESESQAAPLAHEQARDFAALQALASEAPPLPGEEPAPEAAARQPLAAELAGLLQMVSKMVAPILPTVAKIYSDETCDAIGQAVAPVCDKYGWLQDGIGGKYGEEILCLVLVGPIAYATVEAARGDLAARRPRAAPAGVLAGAAIEAEAVPVPVSSPADKTVQVGNVIPA